MEDKGQDGLDWLANASPLLYLISGAGMAGGIGTHLGAEAALRRKGAKSLAPYIADEAMRIFGATPQTAPPADPANQTADEIAQRELALARARGEALAKYKPLARGRKKQFEKMALDAMLADVLPQITGKISAGPNLLQDYQNAQEQIRSAFQADPTQPMPDSRFRTWRTSRNLSRSTGPYMPELPVEAGKAAESGLTRYGVARTAGRVAEGLDPSGLTDMLRLRPQSGLKGLSKSPKALTAIGILGSALPTIANYVIPKYRANQEEQGTPESAATTAGKAQKPEAVKALDSKTSVTILRNFYMKDLERIQMTPAGSRMAARRIKEFLTNNPRLDPATVDAFITRMVDIGKLGGQGN